MLLGANINELILESRCDVIIHQMTGNMTVLPGNVDETCIHIDASDNKDYLNALVLDDVETVQSILQSADR